MARIPRILITGEPTAYHVISRTALPGYPLADVEKDYLVGLIRRYSDLYFTEVMGFAIMGNHFHLLVRMRPESDYSDDMIRERYAAFYGKDRVLEDGRLPILREKYASLSEFIRDIKQVFARFYNRRHDRVGYFWGDRFKSLVVENGDTLINCLAYIDLNPVRAGLVERPEDYRWNSMGYHVQTNNKDDFLSLDFGLKTPDGMDPAERFRRYRRFVYETGAMDKGKGAPIDPEIVVQERNNSFQLSRARRFMYRTRYFTDSGIIGSKAFVSSTYQRVKGHFQAKRDKTPKPISGLNGIYSLKRLTE